MAEGRSAARGSRDGPCIRRTLGLATFVLLSVTACDGGGVLEPEFDAETGQFRVQSPRHPQLLQVVQLTPLSPARGDTLRIEAMLVNLGRSSITVWTRSCGLSTRGTLGLGHPFFVCAAYSGLHTLAPGDTIKGFDQFAVESGAGSHSLEVMHLVEPELWVPLPVTVRDR